MSHKTLTIRSDEVHTYTSSVDIYGEVWDDDWNRSVNNTGDRLIGVNSNVNWRTLVVVPKEKLASINGVIKYIKLIGTPKLKNSCSPARTQAILSQVNCTGSSGEDRLLHNKWLEQGTINNEKKGDLRINPAVASVKAIFGSNYGARRAGIYTTSTDKYTSINRTWSNTASSIPDIEYLFNDSITDNFINIGINPIKLSAIDKEKPLCFYLTRYFGKNETYKAGLGEAGYFYTTNNSWKVEIGYETNIKVTINVKVNGDNAEKNFKKFLAGENGLEFQILDSNDNILNTVSYDDKIMVPIGSKIKPRYASQPHVSLLGTFRTSDDSELKILEATVAKSSMLLDLQLGNWIQIFSSDKFPYNVDNNFKYFGDRIDLPISPDGEINMDISDQVYEGCSIIRYPDPEKWVYNQAGQSLIIPDTYNDSDWSSSYSPYIFTTYIADGMRYRVHNITYNINILGISLVDRQEITYDKISFNEIPSSIKEYVSTLSSRYPGVSLSAVLSNGNKPTWKNIFELSNKDSNYSFSINITSEAAPSAYVKDLSGNISPVILMYKDTEDNLYLGQLKQ